MFSSSSSSSSRFVFVVPYVNWATVQFLLELEFKHWKSFLLVPPSPPKPKPKPKPKGCLYTDKCHQTPMHLLTGLHRSSLNKRFSKKKKKKKNEKPPSRKKIFPCVWFFGGLGFNKGWG